MIYIIVIDRRGPAPSLSCPHSSRPLQTDLLRLGSWCLTMSSCHYFMSSTDVTGPGCHYMLWPQERGRKISAYCHTDIVMKVNLVSGPLSPHPSRSPVPGVQIPGARVSSRRTPALAVSRCRARRLPRSAPVFRSLSFLCLGVGHWPAQPSPAQPTLAHLHPCSR